MARRKRKGKSTGAVRVKGYTYRRGGKTIRVTGYRRRKARK